MFSKTKARGGRLPVGLLAFGLVLFLGIGPAASVAKGPAFDPRLFRKKVAGNETEILVLGTPHLSSFCTLKPGSLEPLLEKLEVFKPDVITIEALSGEDLALLECYGAVYHDAVDAYGQEIIALSKPAKVASGLSRPQAMLKVRAALAEWPVAPDAQLRRRLCLWLAASGDPTSALVQWLRLEPAERIAANGLTAEMESMLNRAITRANENNLLAAPLAARLGLERVYPVDDHSADDAGEEMRADLIKATAGEVAAADAESGRTYSKAYRTLVAQVQASPERLLEMYRFLNLPESQRLDAEEQWANLLSHKSEHHLARVYLGWWETRNLRMVANIRETIASYPGKRVLVIVGASHKPYFEAYLDAIPEVVLADAEAVLK